MEALNRELILACYQSGQISEAQWNEHLKDDLFKKWLESFDA